MTTQHLTHRQVLRRRRIVVLTGLLLVLVGLSMILVRAGQAVWAAADKAFSTGAAVAAAGPDAPAGLSISAIGLDHRIVPGGLDENGAINPDQGEMIWFEGNGRAVPGGEGIAVVAGHVEYYGEPDVFARLGELEVGDELTITQQDGDEITLTVRSSDLLDKEELRTSDLVWGDVDQQRLVALVTCDDELGWRPDGQRAANLVVLAEVTG